jgi:hypothetical protein|nr:MAG TPA: YopX protein [Bacteriophage sp.]
MEDRYLFKAKHFKKWHIGNIVKEPDGLYIRDIKGNVMAYINDESTICQCTGLNDKKGDLIWENDIVKINNSKVNVLITFRDFEIICTIPNEKYYKHRLEYDTEYEVIGNIFDNPELLGRNDE